MAHAHQEVHVRLVLPSVAEIARMQLAPGDALAVKLTNPGRVTEQQAAELRDRIRAVLGRPDLPVLIYGPEIELTAIPEAAMQTNPPTGTSRPGAWAKGFAGTPSTVMARERRPLGEPQPADPDAPLPPAPVPGLTDTPPADDSS